VKYYTGKGKIDNGDGTWFEGTWENGKHHTGNGKVVYDNGGDFEGNWENGIRLVGKGFSKWSNGSWIRGDWEDVDTFSGEGCFKYSNGDILEGTWGKDGFTGKGTRDGGDWLKGEWGQCIDDSSNKSTNVSRLDESAMKESKFTGKGKVTYPCGKMFEGTWKDGKYESGNIEYPKGTRF